MSTIKRIRSMAVAAKGAKLREKSTSGALSIGALPAFVTIASLIGGCVTASPPKPIDCTPVLIIETADSWSRDDVRLSVLKLIDRDLYQDIRDDQTGRLSTAREINVAGTELQGFANYDLFDEARSKEFASYDFEFGTSQAEGYARQFLSYEGAESYTSCRQTNARNISGVHVWVENITPDDVLVAIRWTTSDEDARGSLSGQVTGSPTPFSIVQTQWDPQVERQYVFDRATDRDFRLVLNLDGSTDDVQIPYPPTFENCSRKQTGIETRILRSREIAIAPDDGMRSDEACVLAEEGWRFVPDSAEWMPLYDVMVRTESSAGYVSPLSTGITEQGFRVSEDGRQYCGYLNVVAAAKPTSQKWQLSGSFIAVVERPVMESVCEVSR